MTDQRYYHAYDGRYRAVHALKHTWAAGVPTPIVLELLDKYGISKTASILELGCGEGRDSIAVLEHGYRLLATDVSPEVIRFCRERYLEFASQFQVLDACTGQLDGCFDFIFASCVLHMLVEDADRQAFLQFFRRHLSANGMGLILTMGDGEYEFSTDPSRAFELQVRTNNATQIPVRVPNTTCRMVSFPTLFRELADAGLQILESGITDSLPDFDSLMYVLVNK